MAIITAKVIEIIKKHSIFAVFMHYIDFLIIGQGIAGSSLAYELQTFGAKVFVLDNASENTSSLRAGAIIHAYTSSHWVRNAAAEKYLKTALAQYQDLGSKMDIEFLYPSILKLWEREQNIFTGEVHQSAFSTQAQRRLNFVWHLDAGATINAYRQFLTETNSYRKAAFDYGQLIIEKAQIRYQDILAKKIIFCEGALARHNPFFMDRFQFTLNRGDVLILQIPLLAALDKGMGEIQNIYEKKGIRLIPLSGDKFWCGSNNLWQLDELKPSLLFKEQTQETLKDWLSVPFKILAHTATQRPTTAGQFPLLGLLPTCPEIGIMNGLGTRGFLRAPKYAKALAEMLLSGNEQIKDYDNEKFWQLASKNDGLNK